MFSVSITYHSKIRELSNGNKTWKQIQTSFLSVGPTIFELWVMETELWVMETQKPKQPLRLQFSPFILKYDSNSEVSKAKIASSMLHNHSLVYLSISLVVAKLKIKNQWAKEVEEAKGYPPQEIMNDHTLFVKHISRF